MPDRPNPEAVGGSLPAGHPLALFRREVDALRALLAELRRLVDAGADAGRLRPPAARLREIEHHLARKQSLLYAYLEKHGAAASTRRMWARDADVRRSLRAWLRRLEAATGSEADPDAGAVLDAVANLLAAEEEELMPSCAARFTSRDWAEIHRESPRFGTCLAERGAGYDPPPPLPAGGPDREIVLATGRLSPRQLELLLGTLPMDLTFSDAEDRIVFYSDWPGRHFSRCPAILGRPLAHCHPPASEALLARVMDDLRSGRARVIEAGTERDGRAILTRYIAVRDEDDRYAGCLEVVEDVSRAQELGRAGRLPSYEPGPYR
jgi:DUF438 domain-containing protein